MRPPVWIDLEAGRRWQRRWAALSEEERAEECGMTLEAYRKESAQVRAFGRECGESLNRLTERILKGEK